GNYWSDVARGTVSGFASGVTVAAMRGGKIEMAQIARDAFGNALGESLAAKNTSADTNPFSLARPGERVDFNLHGKVLGDEPSLPRSADDVLEPEIPYLLAAGPGYSGMARPVRQFSPIAAAYLFDGGYQRYFGKVYDSMSGTTVDYKDSSNMASDYRYVTWTALNTNTLDTTENRQRYLNEVSSAGVTAENGKYSSLLPVRPGSTGESLTQEIIYQMGSAFSDQYHANPELRQYVYQLTSDTHDGQLLNVTGLYGASVQETIKRAAQDPDTFYGNFASGDGKLFTGDGLGAKAGNAIFAFAANEALSYKIANDELAPPALRITKGVELAKDVIGAVLDVGLAYDAAKLAFFAGKIALPVVRGGFEGLTNFLRASVESWSPAGGAAFTNLKKMLPQYIGEETGAVWGTKVKYLNETERLKYQLDIKDGKLYDSTGSLFDTANAKSAFGGKGNAIFVMDENGAIYASKVQTVGKFHHSSFLSGEPVATAGELIVENGVLKEVTRRSGHYQPTANQLNQFLDKLRGSGVNLNNVKVGAGF
ncbi:hypothetical protein ACO0LF_30130, partial [Undibacterium sp. Di27W]|uniref:hypothetical protein n=1 Tax=Undibacterium sp. Di27W TaxID=3413036 RepID=UPI003BF3F800